MANPPRSQVEQTLTQRIEELYQERLGKLPKKVTCRLFQEKLAIVLEDPITQPELLLLRTKGKEAVETLRYRLDELMEPQLKAVIEEVVGISVVTLLSDSDLEGNLSGIIALLKELPPQSDSEN